MRLVELAVGRLTDRPSAGQAICGVTLPTRNCSLCRADDPLQRRAVGHSDGDRLTSARVKLGDGHTDLPRTPTRPRADPQCGTLPGREVSPKGLTSGGNTTRHQRRSASRPLFERHVQLADKPGWRELEPNT